MNLFHKDIEEQIKEWDENWQRLAEEDEEARKAGKMVGRIIKHSYADSYAVYKVIREYKNSVRIRVCTGLGDDWVLPAWGSECTIPKAKAKEFFDWQDNLRELFGEGGAEGHAR